MSYITCKLTLIPGNSENHCRLELGGWVWSYGEQLLNRTMPFISCLVHTLASIPTALTFLSQSVSAVLVSAGSRTCQAHFLSEGLCTCCLPSNTLFHQRATWLILPTPLGYCSNVTILVSSFLDTV